MYRLLLLGGAFVAGCSLLLPFDIVGQPCSANEECLTEPRRFVCFQNRCRLLADAGPLAELADSGRPDAGGVDSGRPDAGPTDSGTADSGP
jgi:hypothetical protein